MNECPVGVGPLVFRECGPKTAASAAAVILVLGSEFLRLRGRVPWGGHVVLDRTAVF